MLDKSFKKLLLKSQLLAIEEQECKELDSMYVREFTLDFQEEMALLNKGQRSKQGEPDPDIKLKSKVPVRTLKKLHRKLAMVTHPDISNEDMPFMEVQSAYENGDASKLLSIAGNLDIEIDLTKKEMLSLAKQLREKREKIDALKNTVRWVWCTSEKDENLRARIRRIIGVTDQAWSSYLNKEESDILAGENNET